MKIKINDFQDEDSDGGNTWHEVYQTNVYDINDAVSEIKAHNLSQSDTELPIPVLTGDTEGKYAVEFIIVRLLTKRKNLQPNNRYRDFSELQSV